jgi:polyhydroxyalkanoate synthesis repressor PhaR
MGGGPRLLGGRLLQDRSAVVYPHPPWLQLSSGFSLPACAVRIIKKYPNRRLYDTEISTYVTLDDVRQLVMDGEDFEVQDAKSGQDLTRSVLLQIITEREELGQPMLSRQMLSQLIRYYGDSLQGFMGTYLERSLQVFNEQQQQFRSQLNNLLGQTPWAMMQNMAERNLELFKQFGQGLLKPKAEPPKLDSNPGPPVVRASTKSSSKGKSKT